MARPKKVKMADLEPIPKAQLAEWNKLVAQGKRLVAQSNKAQFGLILLAGEIQSKYGENRIGRFAEAIGISVVTAKTYKSLYDRGVNKEFLDKWGGLGYAKIREILNYCGRTSNTACEYWLQYAESHPQISADALYAHMRNVDTNVSMDKDRIEKDFKWAISQKASRENMKDELKLALEALAEEHPELEDVILQTKFLASDGVDAVKKLEERAGIRSVDYDKRMGELKAFLKKLSTLHRWFSEHIDEYVDIIERNEGDITYDIKAKFDQIARLIEKGLAAKPASWDVDPERVRVVDLEEARKQKAAK